VGFPPMCEPPDSTGVHHLPEAYSNTARWLYALSRDRAAPDAKSHISPARVAPGEKNMKNITSAPPSAANARRPNSDHRNRSREIGRRVGRTANLSHQSSSEVTLRPRKHAAWTDKENQRLKALATSGASVVRAAAALGRTIVSARDQARRLGTPFPSLRIARQRWTDTTRIKSN
jgi:hypothetical protein